MKTRIIAAMFAMALLMVSASTSAGYNTPEVDDMTMHRFNAPRSLAEVVGQDRYQLTTLTEKVDGIIRRGVVTRVRPTGEGFEYTFPEGVDAVYLVDVEIYNPGAQPVELQGIESAIPVRPGHGVRVLIPGGDVTRGPIVMGRLTPAESDSTRLHRASGSGGDVTVAGLYPAVGWPRTWIANIQILTFAVNTNLTPPPNIVGMPYPESINWGTDVTISIPTVDGGTHVVTLPIDVTLHLQVRSGTTVYVGSVEAQQILQINEADDIGPNDLTRDDPVDNRVASIGVSTRVVTNQADYRGNQELAAVFPSFTGSIYSDLAVTLTELGPGTR